jgi:hypothetical protein
MIHQLRIYEIFEHNKAAFHDHYGFDILSIPYPIVTL